MGVTKTEMFSEKVNELAKMAKVLGHPARLSILEYLIKTNACVCGDLVEEIGLAQATISQHLKELKSAGFIKGTIEGTSVCYCIDKDNWNSIKLMFTDFFDQKTSEKTTKCC